MRKATLGAAHIDLRRVRSDTPKRLGQKLIFLARGVAQKSTRVMAPAASKYVPLIKLSHARRVDETRVSADGSGSCPKPDKVHADDASALDP